MKRLRSTIEGLFDKMEKFQSSEHSEDGEPRLSHARGLRVYFSASPLAENQYHRMRNELYSQKMTLS